MREMYDEEGGEERGIEQRHAAAACFPFDRIFIAQVCAHRGAERGLVQYPRKLYYTAD